MKKLFTPYLVVLVCLFSCREVVELDKEFTNANVYAYGFIIDTSRTVEVIVGETYRAIGKPYNYDGSFELIDDASVKIKSNGIETILTYNDFEERYIGEFPTLPEPGQQYQLEIMTPEYGILTSETRVPTIVEEPVVNAKPLSQSDEYYGNTELEISWNSFALEGNYKLQDIVVENAPNSNWYAEYYYFDDQSSILEAEISINNYDSNNNTQEPVEEFELTFNIMDRSGFQFYYSAQDAWYYSGDPFAEPIIVKGNITGGLGVFTAIHPETVSVEVTE